MSIYDFIPNFIKETFQYPSKKVVSAEEWNRLTNYLITQGNHSEEYISALCEFAALLKTQMDGVVLGTIPDGTLTKAKMDAAFTTEVNGLRTDIDKAYPATHSPVLTATDPEELKRGASSLAVAEVLKLMRKLHNINTGDFIVTPGSDTFYNATIGISYMPSVPGNYAIICVGDGQAHSGTVHFGSSGQPNWYPDGGGAGGVVVKEVELKTTDLLTIKYVDETFRHNWTVTSDIFDPVIAYGAGLSGNKRKGGGGIGGTVYTGTDGGIGTYTPYGAPSTNVGVGGAGGVTTYPTGGAYAALIAPYGKGAYPGDFLYPIEGTSSITGETAETHGSVIIKKI